MRWLLQCAEQAEAAAAERRPGSPSVSRYLRVASRYRRIAAHLRSAAEPGEPLDRRIRLVDAGTRRMVVVKYVREIAGVGLRHAKDLVDAAPVELRVLAHYDVGEAIEDLRSYGATVEPIGQAPREAVEGER